MLCVIMGSMIFSSVLVSGERSAIGLYDVLDWGSLLGFGIGMILASFHVCGIMFSLMILL